VKIAGIYAGGTKTACIVVNEKGSIIAESRTGSANYQVVGIRNALAEIKDALRLALIDAGLKKVDLAGIGMAGVDRAADFEKIKEELLPMPGADKVFLSNDGEIVLLGAQGGRPGIVLIAGTGSIIYGIDKDHQTCRVGGWGSILGDEGSGFWLGLKAINAVIKAFEGRGEETGLKETVLKELQLNEVTDLVSFTYQERLPREQIAFLAPAVFRLAAAGDKTAVEITN